ncbi:MAG: hypothetical protein ACR2H3_07250 [Acidimicrobiales bacterium]
MISRPTTRDRVRASLSIAAIVMAVASGCARSGTKLGGGEDVDVCRGWGELDGLEEPIVDDRDAMLAWGEGSIRILDRIDTRFKVDKKPVPKTVDAKIETAETALRKFVEQVKQAGDDSALRAAQRSLADDDYDEAVGSIASFTRARC